MDKNRLEGLASVNQLRLEEKEEDIIVSVFSKLEEKAEKLTAYDLENVEPMVHVISLTNVLREDECIKKFSRDDLQKDAPEEMDGYWQVPRLVE